MASRDSDERNICRPKNPASLIRKLVELMDHPISQNATQRHLQLLQEFINASHYAFWLQDIPYIIRLYESIVKRLENTSEFRNLFECLLHFSAVPPMMTKVSDRLEYARDFEQYFSSLGYLILSLHEDELKQLVLSTVKQLLEYRPPDGYYCVLHEDCNTAIEHSRLPEILAELTKLVNDGIYPLLLDLIFLVCKISKKTCQQMLSQNALENLLQRFEPTWRERDEHTKPKNPSRSDTIPHFEETCCVLWKLLNAIDDTITVKDPSPFALWSLQYAFRWSNVCSGQKLNRNNLTALILKIILVFPTYNFSETEIFEDILILATTAAGCGCLSDLVFTEDEMDFQFKKIIWACLHFFQPTRPFVFTKENEIVKAMLKKIFQEHSTDKNHIEQYCELVKIALKIIPKYLCSAEVFMHLNGPIKIVRIIDGYLLKTYNIEVLEAYLHCLSEVLFQNDENIASLIGENNTADIVLGVCIKILEITTTLSTMYQKALARGFCILQILCSRGYLFNLQAVVLCIDYLKRVIQPPESDPLIDVRVTICAIHLLWECITTSKRFYVEFLKNGGIYILLDLTEACTFSVKSLSLGVLSDASRKPSSIPYFITWRKHGKRLLSMLLEIFRNKTEKDCNTEENVELQHEKLKNVWLSLCQTQRIYFQTGCIQNDELLKICRSRIHGILFSVKIKLKQKVALANEHYKLFNEKLNTDDELTILFAENFLSLTMCNSWLNVAKELKTDGITLVGADNDNLKERVQTIKQWKSFLRDLIETIVQKGMKNEKNNEIETYSILREPRLSDALDALKELRYLSNCTERMFQMRQSLVLQQDVETTRAPSANFHRTICELPFTNIYNQSISIQSNIIYEKKEEQVPPTPVSWDSNASLSSNNSEHNLDEHLMHCAKD